MKLEKSPGPLSATVEIIKASPDQCSQLIADLINNIIKEGKIPEEWNNSYIISLFKGKGSALDRGNYHGLKLTDQVLKVVERVIEKIMRECIVIDDMEFGFMPGCGTTDAIFIVRQLQEKVLNKNQNLYFAFIDLEKAFDRVSCKVLWWAMHVVGVPVWIVVMVQAMYNGAKSKVRVNGSHSDEFEVQVSVHQGSVLSPLLFTIVFEALSREFQASCPWELLYADDFVLIAEILDLLVEKLNLWKNNMENKGLRVNMGKTKVMIYGKGLYNIKPSGKYPCRVCRKGVGRISIFCTSCDAWVHEKCSGIKGRLVDIPVFKCHRCLDLACPIDGRPVEHVSLGDEKLDVLESFVYLGDGISSNGGCEVSTIAKICSAWRKFHKLLPLITNQAIPLKSRGEVYNSCIFSAILFGSECWALTTAVAQRLK